MSNHRAFYTNQHCVSKYLRALITQQKHKFSGQKDVFKGLESKFVSTRTNSKSQKNHHHHNIFSLWQRCSKLAT